MSSSDCYIAVRFKDRPDLHMTLAFRKGTSPEDLCLEVEDKFTNEGPYPLEFNKMAMFGSRHNVRVLLLTDRLPFWISRFVVLGCRPHVTCDDEAPLSLVATSIAVMCKKEVIREWQL